MPRLQTIIVLLAEREVTNLFRMADDFGERILLVMLFYRKEKYIEFNL